MQQNNKTIRISDLTEQTSRALLTENGIIELQFTGISESERLQEIEKLYQILKTEFIENDIRKTYQIKSSTAAAFEKISKKNGEKLGKNVTMLMSKCIKNVKAGKPMPEPAVHEKGVQYQKKSYRVSKTISVEYQNLCDENHVPAGPVMQTLMEHHISQKGD